MADINVFDLITVTESVTEFIPFFNISVTDSVTVSESMTRIVSTWHDRIVVTGSSWSDRTPQQQDEWTRTHRQDPPALWSET